MLLLFISILFLVISCSEPFNENDLLSLDLKPPLLEEVHISNSRSLIIHFDEPVQFNDNSYQSDPFLSFDSWSAEENKLTIYFTEDQVSGRMYKIRGEVEDERGNSLSFLIRFYGWNPRMPQVLINEFNPEGSGNNPDTIELFVQEEGNTAGLTVFTGTSNYYNELFVLPSLEVEQGDFIILHLQPEAIAEEVTETTDKTLSGGKLSSPEAWDIWVTDDMKLSGKNGLISVYTNPFGSIMDAVPYSNRVSADSEDYHGWTSATFDMISELSLLNVWEGTDGFIRPEDAVYSEGTTGTRSICRDSSSTDRDNRQDWHIVPTGEKSFGISNTDLVYSPD